MDIQKAIKTLNSLVFCGSCTTGPCKDCDRKNAKDTAIQGLKELEQYRQIGTAEECRAAREKSKRKKTELNRSGEYICPVCRRLVTKYYDLHCSWCGQALDWSESEDVQ